MKFTFLFKKLGLFLICFFLANSICAEKLVNSSFTISLSSNQFLTITNYRNYELSISISENGKTHQLISVDKAIMSQSSVKAIKLCHDFEEVYFIPASDQSSTYGATTGIIAWQDDNFSWWLTVLPFSVADVEDSDNDGIYELVDRYAEGSEKFKPVKKSYQFKKGIICPK